MKSIDVGELEENANASRTFKQVADKPEASQLYPQKAMKAKKKEFLQRKKSRRKPGSKVSPEGGSEGSDSDLEERVMSDKHKPAFGEQAMQPLKVCPTTHCCCYEGFIISLQYENG